VTWPQVVDDAVLAVLILGLACLGLKAWLVWWRERP